jgi:hypothetical protein
MRHLRFSGTRAAMSEGPEDRHIYSTPPPQKPITLPTTSGRSRAVHVAGEHPSRTRALGLNPHFPTPRPLHPIFPISSIRRLAQPTIRFPVQSTGSDLKIPVGNQVYRVFPHLTTLCYIYGVPGQLPAMVALQVLVALGQTWLKRERVPRTRNNTK